MSCCLPRQELCDLVSSASKTKRVAWAPLVLVAAALTWSGCAPSISALRAPSPLRSASFSGAYGDVAACTASRLEDIVGPAAVQLSERAGDARVVVHGPPAVNPFVKTLTAVYELTFTPEGSGVAVGLSGPPGDDAEDATARVWHQVEVCGTTPSLRW